MENHNLTPCNYFKKGLYDVMSNVIKNLSVSSLSPIGFEVEWHNSWSEKWYRSQGYKFESRECYCERGIVGGTTIWFPTTTLKIGFCGVLSNDIKDLSVSSSSTIGFEVEWHNSRSDNYVFMLITLLAFSPI